PDPQSEQHRNRRPAAQSWAGWDDQSGDREQTRLRRLVALGRRCHPCSEYHLPVAGEGAARLAGPHCWLLRQGYPTMTQPPALVIVTSSFPISGDGSEAAGTFVADLAEELAKHVPIRIVAPGRADGREPWPG